MGRTRSAHPRCFFPLLVEMAVGLVPAFISGPIPVPPPSSLWLCGVPGCVAQRGLHPASVGAAAAGCVLFLSVMALKITDNAGGLLVTILLR